MKIFLLSSWDENNMQQLKMHHFQASIHTRKTWINQEKILRRKSETITRSNEPEPHLHVEPAVETSCWKKRRKNYTNCDVSTFNASTSQGMGTASQYCFLDVFQWTIISNFTVQICFHRGHKHYSTAYSHWLYFVSQKLIILVDQSSLPITAGMQISMESDDRTKFILAITLKFMNLLILVAELFQ